MPSVLPRSRPVTELHTHLGGAVAPAIRCRRRGLGVTVHSGESGPVEEIIQVIEQLALILSTDAEAISARAA